MAWHLASFLPEIRRFGPLIVDATIALHRTVCTKFLPTAVKFYYSFNLRDVSCIFQVTSWIEQRVVSYNSRFSLVFLNGI